MRNTALGISPPTDKGTDFIPNLSGTLKDMQTPARRLSVYGPAPGR